MNRRSKLTETRRKRGMVREGGYGREMEELDELDAVLNLTPDDDEEAEMLGDLDLDDLDITVDVSDDDDDAADDDGDFEFDMDAEVDVEGGDAGDDEEVEIDEAVIRRAIAEMRGKRSRRGRRLYEDAVDAADSFGGGEAGDEMFIDVDEDTLINVLADELGRVDTVGTAAPAIAEARRRRRARGQRHIAESAEKRVNRRRLAEATRENVHLKKQLQEMNLFSAKLLYVNKIFNGQNVTTKQRRAIVEAMDNAKTLREAKLLYRSILQSIGDKKETNRLSESTTRVLGSSSRTTPSAQPANSGVEIDRWATLAGLKEGK